MEVKSKQKQATSDKMFFFTQRIISIWNKLPASVVEASSVNSFKKRLDDWSKDVEI